MQAMLTDESRTVTSGPICLRSASCQPYCEISRTPQRVDRSSKRRLTRGFMAASLQPFLRTRAQAYAGRGVLSLDALVAVPRL